MADLIAHRLARPNLLAIFMIVLVHDIAVPQRTGHLRLRSLVLIVSLGGYSERSCD